VRLALSADNQRSPRLQEHRGAAAQRAAPPIATVLLATIADAQDGKDAGRVGREKPPAKLPEVSEAPEPDDWNRDRVQGRKLDYFPDPSVAALIGALAARHGIRNKYL
jgi:hypothetical protein